MAKTVRGISWFGTAGDDVFTGTAGNDDLHGGDGNDTINGGDGSDQIYGNAGNDTLGGGLGDDTIYGHEGDDTISGGDGNDYLAGQEGNDRVDGGAGNDFLGAGPGNDTLTGGAGADRFFFAANFDTTMNVHTITDFNAAQGDYIDLRSIDADGNPSNDGHKGNTDFTLVSGPSSTPGTAWMEAYSDPVTGAAGVSIYLNTDSDADADTRIDIVGATTLHWGTDILG